MLKVMVIGPFSMEHRETAIVEGFRRAGCIVKECDYGDLAYSDRLVDRIQRRLASGPLFDALTRRVCITAGNFMPDVMFFRRPLEFSGKMIANIRAICPALYVAYNNDDPFSAAYADVRWRTCRSAIPEFDAHFAFRRVNIPQYLAAGARKTYLWEPYFVPWIHFPSAANHPVKDSFSLLFAMHAEADERRSAVHALLSKGFRVDVHTWRWDTLFGLADAASVGAKEPIHGDAYRSAINGASATLCFFSKQNNDELTSRVFEIPACGGLLLSSRTERLTQLFKDREEAFFFSSIDELVEIATHLRANPDVVMETKRRGRERLLASRHSVVDRCEDAVKIFDQLVK